jgi:hypothetical protein
MRLTLLLAADFTNQLAGRPILSGGVGPSGRIAVLTGTVESRLSELQPRHVLGAEPEPAVTAIAALFANALPGPIREFSLEPTVVRYPIVQPLRGGRLLVVNSRVNVREGPNAFVFDDLGRLTRRALFGDGIDPRFGRTARMRLRTRATCVWNYLTVPPRPLEYSGEATESSSLTGLAGMQPI